MLANQLKGLLTSCPDKTDLPTPAMVEAAADLIDDWLIRILDGDISSKEAATWIWDYMIDALREDGLQPPKDYEDQP